MAGSNHIRVHLSAARNREACAGVVDHVERVEDIAGRHWLGVGRKLDTPTGGVQHTFAWYVF